jgi:outer membrane protein W
MANKLLGLGLAVTLTSVGGAALAQEPTSGGAIELGARLGFGLPFGSEGRTATDTTNDKLSDSVSGIIPLWIDAGYRFNPNLYVGLFFQYAFALVNTDTNPECDQSGVSCSISDIRLGANLHYHFAPGQSFDPWLGLGAGYEWLMVSVSAGANSASGSAGGFEFANFQLGGDFSASPSFKVGPFLSFSLGQYRSLSASLNGGPSMDMDYTNKSLHEWLIIGARGAFDIGI